MSLFGTHTPKHIWSYPKMSIISTPQHSKKENTETLRTGDNLFTPGSILIYDSALIRTKPDQRTLTKKKGASTLFMVVEPERFTRGTLSDETRKALQSIHDKRYKYSTYNSDYISHSTNQIPKRETKRIDALGKFGLTDEVVGAEPSPKRIRDQCRCLGDVFGRCICNKGIESCKKEIDCVKVNGVCSCAHNSRCPALRSDCCCLKPVTCNCGNSLCGCICKERGYNCQGVGCYIKCNNLHRNVLQDHCNKYISATYQPLLAKENDVRCPHDCPYSNVHAMAPEGASIDYNSCCQDSPNILPNEYQRSDLTNQENMPMNNKNSFENWPTTDPASRPYDKATLPIKPSFTWPFQSVPKERFDNFIEKDWKERVKNYDPSVQQRVAYINTKCGCLPCIANCPSGCVFQDESCQAVVYPHTNRPLFMPPIPLTCSFKGDTVSAKLGLRYKTAAHRRFQCTHPESALVKRVEDQTVRNKGKRGYFSGFHATQLGGVGMLIGR